MERRKLDRPHVDERMEGGGGNECRNKRMSKGKKDKKEGGKDKEGKDEWKKRMEG